MTGRDPPETPVRREGLLAARASAYENPRPDLQRHVPASARRILDLGCASGAVGAAIKARQDAEVVGIEAEPVYATDARRRLDQVVEVDLEELAGDAGLVERLGRFDCLLAGDVLEHLRDPWKALASFAALLRPGGTAVISLPNVRYWQVLYEVFIRGHWPRAHEGIFDVTHLRWFTTANGIELARTAGLETVEIDRVFRVRPSVPAGPGLSALLERIPLRPFFTFQFIVVAMRPSDDG